MLGVNEIVEDVRERGDAAVRRVGAEARRRRAGARRAGRGRLPEEAILALADRVRRWHEAQRPARRPHGGRAGSRARAALGAARVRRDLRSARARLDARHVRRPGAGRRRRSGSSSRRRRPAPGSSRAAARLLGIDEVWALGGPHAIAAFAYGTWSIAHVDKIVGPGGPYVNEAKLARLARRRHRPARRPVRGGGAARPRRRSPARRARARRAGASTATTATCRIVEAGDDLEAALAEVERIAPEHLVLLGEAEALADRVRNAGAVFVGEWSPVPTGDYATGGEPRAADERLGALGRRARARDVPQAGDGAAADARGARARAADGRGARRRRGHACARRGGPAVKPLAPEFNAVPVGAVDGGARASRRPRSGRRSSASTGTCRRCRFRATRPGGDRGRARARERISRTAAIRASDAAIAEYAGVEPENVVLGAGADDLILLVRACVRRARRHGRDPAGADVPALPDRRAARRRRGRRRRRRC